MGIYILDFNRFILIEIDDRNNRLLVRMKLHDKNGFAETYKFVLDTGASNTTISPEITDILNLDIVGKTKVNGKDAKIVRLLNVAIEGKMKYATLDMLIQDFSRNKGVFGLLGMNVLGKYDFAINLSESRMYYIDSKKPISKCRNPYATTLLSNKDDSYHILEKLSEILPSSVIEIYDYEDCLKFYEDKYMPKGAYTKEEIIEHIKNRKE